MKLEITERTSVRGSLTKDAPLVYYGRVEPIESDALVKIVPQSELELAKRYSNSVYADTFLASRFALRKILSSFLNVDPRSLNLAYTKTGKPYLFDSDVNFNLAHSKDVLAVAFARGVQIGVDVECMDRDVDVVKMLSMLCSPAEQILIEKIEPVRRRQLFIELWTKKEAILKASGSGLSQPMNELNLTTNDSSDMDAGLTVKMGDTYWKVESRNILEKFKLSVAFECKSLNLVSGVKLSYLNLQECTP